MAKKQTKSTVELDGAEFVESIQPQTIATLKDRYLQDRSTLIARMEQEQKQISAFEGAIAACDEILNAHTRTDKVEIDG